MDITNSDKFYLQKTSSVVNEVDVFPYELVIRSTLQ